MANKYVSSAGPKGAGDGSSEANAWSLANAFASASPGDYVYIKNDGTYSGVYTISASGSYTADTHIYFIGYNSVIDLTTHITDMDYGQAYWGGPLNPSLANGWCDIDGGAASGRLMYASYKYNLHFRNMYFHNISGNYDTVKFQYCRNTSFTKCKFRNPATTTYFGLMSYRCYNTKVNFGYFTGPSASFYSVYDYNTMIYNSYFETTYDPWFGSGTFAHNLIVGGAEGIIIWNYGSTLHNNVFYNQSNYCIGYGHSSLYGNVCEYNNIFMPADKGVTLISKVDNGTLGYSGYSCAWALSNGGEVMTTPYAGEYGLNENPLLADVTNDDFTPRNPNVLRGGKPDIAGNFTQMGAVFVPQYFSRGSRIFNPGRLSIIRN